ncbi:MAG TPA: proton-conducting transporter membrane subunit [Candidatus Acidoferrum sp.]|nr:proton-conducting transporter membrane subunit [Candidatus Acidoferrum sp.]
MNSVAFPLMLAFVFCGIGILLAAVLPERRIPTIVAWCGSLAALAAIWASGAALSGAAFHYGLWAILSVGRLSVGVDHLSAFFILLAALVVLPSSIFSATYLKRYWGHYSLSAFAVWYLLLFASIIWILIASDILSFLLAWESMSLLSYFLVSFEYQREGTSAAGYLMLAMGEAGFMAVEIVLIVLAARSGSLEFSSLKAAVEGLGPVAHWAIFLATFFGFGVKAGLIPVNSWLPRAHPAAPANVSAILSGVILNLGLYGIVRLDFDIVPVTTLGPGVLILLVGTASALVGILYATTETDLKTVLAHSSIENMGVIAVGLGAGVIFTTYNRPFLTGMAFTAAFLHTINHSIYKALLFLGAGAIDDRSGTRDLDKLGGLARAMPWTAGAFLVGSLAISGIPPFNGFVSEWLTLQTLLRSAELPSALLRIVFALCGAGLALTAALAVTCFVKAFAMAFLGVSRSEPAAKAIETRAPALAGMVFLAVLCFLLGVLPTYVISGLDHRLQPFIPSGTVSRLVPPFFISSPAHAELPRSFVSDFRNLGAQVGQEVLPGPGLVVLHRGGTANPVVFAVSPSYGFVALVLFVLATWLAVRWLARKQSAARGEVWAGGIPRLLSEMTYTATGFSNPVRVVFQAVFRPNTIEDTRETVAVHFRTAIRRRRDETYLVDRLFFHPVGAVVTWFARLFARMHHGRLSAYVAYSLVFLVVLLVLFRLS